MIIIVYNIILTCTKKSPQEFILNITTYESPIVTFGLRVYRTTRRAVLETNLSGAPASVLPVFLGGEL